MAVISRLTALFVVISGIALLFIDDPIPAWFPNSIEAIAGSAWQLGSSLPDIVLYGVGMTAAVSLLIANKLVSAPPARRARPGRRAISTGTSTNSTTSTAVSSTNLDQPSEVNEASNEDTESPQEVRQGQSDISSPVVDPQPSTTQQESQQLHSQSQEIQRATIRTRSTSSQIPVRKSAYTTRRYRTAPQRHTPATESDNPYFKPIEYDRSISFVDVNTRFSYLDVDVGPSFFEFNPVPNLVEIEIGPSAVSYDLVRSPIEIKISSLLKTLLAPTSNSPSATPRNDNTQLRTTQSKHTRRRPDDTRHSRDLDPRYTREPGDREQPQPRHRTAEPVDPVQAEKQPNRAASHPPEQGLIDHGNSSLDTSRPTSWDYDKPANDEGSGHSLFPEREMELIGEPISTPEIGVVDEPVFEPVQDERWEEETQANVGQEYSPPQREPPRSEAADPLGLDSFDPVFPDPDEPLVESLDPVSAFFDDQNPFSVGEFDQNHDVSMLEPSVDPGMAEEMLGLNWFDEIPDDQIGLPGFSDVDEPDPWFPDSENIFPSEFEEDDWLSF